MSLEQAILEAVRALPPEKQQEILNHATRLRDRVAKKKPFKSVRGCGPTWAFLCRRRRSKRTSAKGGRAFRVTGSDVRSRGRYACDDLVSLR